MEYSFAMDIFETIDDLSKDELGLVFIQLPPSSHEGEEVTTSADLHDVDDMAVDFETLIQPDNVLVPSPFQYVVFLSNFFQWIFIFHHLLVNTFKSNEFTCETLNGQIDFTKCTFSNHFAYFVVVNLGFKVLNFIILNYQIEL